VSHSLDDLRERLEAARDLPDLKVRIARTIDDLGFSHFTYLAVRRPEAPDLTFYFSTYPKPWTEHYEQRRYVKIDPVMIDAWRSNLPFQWRGETIRGRADKQQLRIFDEAGEFGISDGITVPVHGAGGEFAVLSATPGESGSFDKLFRARQCDMHLLALYGHAAVARFIDACQPAAVRLSPRERECLLWTARGKTAWEVGEILKLSQGTVTWHLNNAKTKLGVYSKSHAVVKALMLGLIAA
jgi:LuxR family transcriptional regulator, activator of conjugal transfer of Ti plasmids